MFHDANYIEEENNSDGEEQQQQHVGDSLPNQLAVQKHLSKDMFARPLRAIIDIDIIASPAELAQTEGSNVWSLLPHLTKELKQNLALKNRDAAGAEHLAGNLARCIPLHLEILQQKNTFPYFMGIQVPGMLPKNLHRHGACVWRVPPETQTMLVVNQFMYQNMRKCSPEDLSNDVRFVAATKTTPKFANVTVGTLAYKTLLDSLSAGAWQEEYSRIDLDNIFEPSRTTHQVQVTAFMGEQIVELLKAPLEETVKSCINLEDFNITMHRADGHGAFDLPKGISGELVGKGTVSATKINTERLQKRYCFHIKAALDYQLFE